LTAWTTNSFSIKRPIPLHHVSCQAYSRNPINFPITKDTQAYLVNWLLRLQVFLVLLHVQKKFNKLKIKQGSFYHRVTTLLQLRSTAAKRPMQEDGCLASMSGFYSIWVS
jgi:hypothetical protein